MNQQTKCKMCGGDLVEQGDLFVCEWCGSKWEKERTNDAEAVEYANAWIALREGDFQKATELFEELIMKKPKHHEAYWGRALAKHGIMYVVDYNESKRVPTCNSIREESFVDDSDVQKTIKYAPHETEDTYRTQAEQIESIRKEWLEKARHEPKYDVFISYKDSDGQGSRTQDSVDASELYTLLTEAGYRVFFSRVSLRDKVSEHYEPYIYNAIKTAKVMIVFGSKPEYFTSTWIKNEWHRFKLRLENGEKHRNSLVVVYNGKTMDPSGLPVVLKQRQCLDASTMGFYETLKRHIKRVVDESSGNVAYSKIKIESNTTYEKATSIPVNEVVTKEVGKGMVVETSIDELQTIKLMYTYLKEQEWKEAEELIDDILFDNPNCAEASWARLYVEFRAKNDEELKLAIKNKRFINFEVVDRTLNTASKDFAREKLNFLYDIALSLESRHGLELLKKIVEFSYPDRERKIQEVISLAIRGSKYATKENSTFYIFKYLTGILPSGNVDEYIGLYLEYAETTLIADEKHQCYEKVLSIDKGNQAVLQELLKEKLLEERYTSKDCVDTLEALLKYSKNSDEQIKDIIAYLIRSVWSAKTGDFAKELLRYYSGELSEISEDIVKLGASALSHSFFGIAIHFFTLVISFKKNLGDAYWGLCLAKIEARSEKDVKNSEIFLNDIPEFKKCLTYLNDDEQSRLINLARSQVVEYRKKQKNILVSELNVKKNARNTLTEKIKDCNEKIAKLDEQAKQVTEIINESKNASMSTVIGENIAAFVIILVALGLFSGGIVCLVLSFVLLETWPVFIFLPAVIVSFFVSGIATSKAGGDPRHGCAPVFPPINFFVIIYTIIQRTKSEKERIKQLKTLAENAQKTIDTLNQSKVELRKLIETVREQIKIVDNEIQELKQKIADFGPDATERPNPQTQAPKPTTTTSTTNKIETDTNSGVAKKLYISPEDADAISRKLEAKGIILRMFFGKEYTYSLTYKGKDQYTDIYSAFRANKY